jgi:hypothetical protein
MTLGCLVFTVASVSAALIHEYLPPEITEVPKGCGASESEPPCISGPLVGFGRMTVDSGHVWVAEGKDLDEFEASTGVFLAQFPGEPSVSYSPSGAGGIAVGQPAGGEPLIYAQQSSGGKEAVAVLSEKGALEATWTGAETPPKSFGMMKGVAADDSTEALDEGKGNVYVIGFKENERSGAAIEPAVDVFRPGASGAEHYVGQIAGPETPCVYGEAGCVNPATHEPCAEGEAGCVKLFVFPRAVAVDQANGDLVVLDGKNDAIVADVFEPAPMGAFKFVRQIAGPQGSFKAFGVSAVAVDPVNGDIYIATEIKTGPGEREFASFIEQFGPEGAYLARIAGTALPQGSFGEGIRSLSVEPVSEDLDLYAAGIGVAVFSKPFTVPDVVPTPPTPLGPTTATLTGTVNPLSAETHEGATCAFEFGTSTSYGTPAPCSAPVPHENAPVPVQSEEIKGLSPDTTYFYRLLASNVQEGKRHSNPSECPEACGQFTTAGAGVRDESVSTVTASSAELAATIAPNNGPSSAIPEARTSYYFQYNTTGTAGCTPATCQSLPAPPGTGLGVSEAELAVTQPAAGLTPGTLYHYRVVAVSEVAPKQFYEDAGPDQTFTTQPANGGFVLPDGRQYEQVTPPHKHGALFYPTHFIANYRELDRASVAGDAFVALASQPSESEPQGNSNHVTVLMGRTSSGWSSQVLAPPNGRAVGSEAESENEYRDFSADLAQGVVQPFGGFFTPLSPEASEPTPYLRTNYLNHNIGEPCKGSYLTSGTCYQPLVTAANTPPGTVFGVSEEETSPNHTTVVRCLTARPEKVNFCGPIFLYATPDLGYMILKSQGSVQLTAAPDPEAFYEWSGGQLQPLYLLPAAEGGGGVFVGQEENDALLQGAALRDHQLADDGSVFFSYEGRLYDHDFAMNESYRLDVAHNVPEPAKAEAEFLYASADGSKVFFRDPQQLTSAPGGGLYECRVVQGACGELLLTGLAVPGPSLGGSEDASYLYFVDPSGRFYVDHYQDGGWSTSQGPLVPGLGAIGGEGTLNALIRSSVSPNGRYFAFESSADLTGYDTTDAHSKNTIEGYRKLAQEDREQAAEGRTSAINSAIDEQAAAELEAVRVVKDQEVYLYDAATGHLSCASCDPTGARPVGIPPRVGGGDEEDSSEISHAVEAGGVAAGVPATQGFSTVYALGPSGYQPRYLSDSGRLFFDGYDALVPQDTNGTGDVYEYEPAGVPAGAHACSPSSVSGSDVFEPARAFRTSEGEGEAGAGCTALISSGTSPQESTFLDASETGGEGPGGEELSEGGGDVFFLSNAKLVPQDVEASPVIYDAHECTTSSPCPPPAAEAPPVCTTETSCKAAATPQPTIFAPSGSATFNGLGNLISPPPAIVKKVTAKTVTCKKGFVKKKVKNKQVCVKKPKKKSKAKKSAHTNRRTSR